MTAKKILKVTDPPYLETTLTSSSRERELAIAIGLDVGAAYHAAYVNNMRLGFLLRLAVAIHHYLPRVILHF